MMDRRQLIGKQRGNGPRNPKATTTRKPGGDIEQTVVQSNNPAQTSRQDQETVRTRSYTVPAGSQLHVRGTPNGDDTGVLTATASFRVSWMTDWSKSRTESRERKGIRFMSNDVIHTAMATWAAKDLPARLLAAQVAKLLNCTTDDVAIRENCGRWASQSQTR
jgi:hypothetical protein